MWRRLRKGASRFCALLHKWGIFGDIRSTLVGSLVGAVVALIAAAWAAEAPKERWIFTNDEGYAQPMRILLDPLEREEGKITIRFEPEDLEQIYVCEYAHLTGSSYREILFTYLDRYSMCLWVAEMSSSEYIIRANTHSGFLDRRNGNWLCKCVP